MADLAGGNIGPEASWDVKFEGGKLKATLAYAGEQGGANMELYLSADAVLDAIAEAIPGTVDDTVIALLKGALKNV